LKQRAALRTTPVETETAFENWTNIGEELEELIAELSLV